MPRRRSEPPGGRSASLSHGHAAHAGRVDGHRARKRFGQHFLSDLSVVEAIVRAIAPREGEHILEIGPGLGVLTQELLQRVSHIDAVELDRDLAARLLRRWPAERLRLHAGDALRFDLASARFDGSGSPSDTGSGSALRPSPGCESEADPQPWRVVGNLPYNISSPLLLALLFQRAQVLDQHFMLQEEVVDRVVAQPETPLYGRLSVLMQTYYDCEKLFSVPPEAFDPPPRVQSAVMRMRVRAGRQHEDTAALEAILAAAFGQRRKMLRGTLLPWLAARGLQAPEIAPTARAEEVEVDVWRGLAQRFAALEPGASPGSAHSRASGVP